MSTEQSVPLIGDKDTVEGELPFRQDRSASLEVEQPVPKDHRSSSLEAPGRPSQPVQTGQQFDRLKGISHDSGHDSQGSSRHESIDKGAPSVIEGPSNVMKPETDAKSEAKPEAEPEAKFEADPEAKRELIDVASLKSGMSSQYDNNVSNGSGQMASGPSSIVPSICLPISGDEDSRDSAAQKSDSIPSDHLLADRHSPIPGTSGIHTGRTTHPSGSTISSARTKSNITWSTVKVVKTRQPTPTPPVIEHWGDILFTVLKYLSFVFAVIHFIGSFIGIWLSNELYPTASSYVCSLFFISIGSLSCAIFGTFESSGGAHWTFVSLLFYIPLHVFYWIDLPVSKVWWFHLGIGLMLTLAGRILSEILCNPSDLCLKYKVYRYAISHHEVFEEKKDGEEAETGEGRSSRGISSRMTDRNESRLESIPSISINSSSEDSKNDGKTVAIIETQDINPSRRALLTKEDEEL